MRAERAPSAARAQAKVSDVDRDLELLTEALERLEDIGGQPRTHGQDPAQHVHDALSHIEDLRGRPLDESERAAAFDLVRRTHRLHAGLSTADWWTSPGGNERVREVGMAQLEREAYMRSKGSAAVAHFEEEFMQNYFGISLGEPERSCIITSSGMSAFHLALMFCAAFRLDPARVGWHRGVYSEMPLLARSVFPGSNEVPAGELGERVTSGAVDLLIVEPNNNWPPGASVRLDNLIDSARARKTLRPFFLIFDQTHSGPFLRHELLIGDDMPPNVVVFLVGSHLKYHQIGLDVAHAGYLLVAGRILGFRKYAEHLDFLRQAMTVAPNPTVVRSLPRLSRQSIRDWMWRIGRNAGIYLDVLGELQERLPGMEVLSIRNKVETKLIDPSWMGGLLFVRIRGSETFETCDELLREFLAMPDRPAFGVGTSFGFPHSRLSVAQDWVTGRADNCALRIAVGAEDVERARAGAEYLLNFFLKSSPHSLASSGFGSLASN